MPWPPNRHNSLPCTVRTSKQRTVQSKGWLSANSSMARIYDLWDGSLDQRKVRGLVPCWLSSSSTTTTHRYMQIQWKLRTEGRVRLSYCYLQFLLFDTVKYKWRWWCIILYKCSKTFTKVGFLYKWYISMQIDVSIYLFIYQAMYLSIHTYVYISIHLSIYLSIRIYIFLSIEYYF